MNHKSYQWIPSGTELGTVIFIPIIVLVLSLGILLLFLLYVCVCFLHVVMGTVCVWCPCRSEEGIRSPRTTATDVGSS